ncbi:MAG: hypothetical protein VYA34_07135 [Myxococcota bacterium]|nr:hypothetical protein [Myxococcota bacterium]
MPCEQPLRHTLIIRPLNLDQKRQGSKLVPTFNTRTIKYRSAMHFNLRAKTTPNHIAKGEV